MAQIWAGCKPGSGQHCAESADHGAGTGKMAVLSAPGGGATSWKVSNVDRVAADFIARQDSRILDWQFDFERFCCGTLLFGSHPASDGGGAGFEVRFGAVVAGFAG